MKALRERLRKYPWRQNIIAMIPLVLVTIAAFVVLGNEQQVEDFCTAVRNANPLLIRAADRFSDYGNIIYYVLYAGLLATGLIMRRRSLVHFVIGYVVALIMALLLVDVLKFTLGRPRPYSDNAIDFFTSDDDNQSFPSAHVGETLYTVTPLAQRYGKTLLPALLGFSPAIMAVCRMLLGEHHPSDFIGSMVVACIGACVAWLCSRALSLRPDWSRRLQPRRRNK